MPEDWTQREREAVDAVTEAVCAQLWATKHEYDSIHAARNWDTVQEWVKEKRDKASPIEWEDIVNAKPILSMAKQYEADIERHRAIVQFCVEEGFIAACDLHFNTNLTTKSSSRDTNPSDQS